MNKERIVVLTSTFPRWPKDSTPPFVFQLSERLTKKFEVYVITPYSKGSKLTEKINDVIIKRFRYWFDIDNNLTDKAIIPSLGDNPLLYFQIIPFLIAELIALYKTCKIERINKIHAHWIIPQGLIAVIYKIFFNGKAKILITSHGADAFGLKKFDWLKRWVVNNSDEITVVSKSIKVKIKNLGIKNSVPIKVIPMGTSSKRFRSTKFDNSIKTQLNINGILILFVGRLTEKKGLEYLIRAMPAIIEKYPETKLLIIGDGEKAQNYFRLSRNLGLTKNNIKFLGGLPNEELPKYYATADIFVGPSIQTKGGDTEGFGLVFVEALMSGTSVISSNLPAVGDIIKHDVTGILVNQRNVREISNAIIYLIKNPQKRKKLAKNGCEYVKSRFSWEIIGNKYRKILEEL
jgi:glycosyltransferase involved in cell wall biosynthesis